ncbi:hypothetical protein JHK87_004112 [Glycine soja]|nr:hypothetical protein JHK87_004112 [Glycine soja]
MVSFSLQYPTFLQATNSSVDSFVARWLDCGKRNCKGVILIVIFLLYFFNHNFFVDRVLRFLIPQSN